MERNVKQQRTEPAAPSRTASAASKTLVLAQRNLPLALELHALTFLSIDDLVELFFANKDCRALVESFIPTNLKSAVFHSPQHLLLRLVLTKATRLTELRVLGALVAAIWPSLQPALAGCLQANRATMLAFELGQYCSDFLEEPDVGQISHIEEALAQCTKLRELLLPPPFNFMRRAGTTLLIGPEHVQTLICREGRALELQNEFKACTSLRTLIVEFSADNATESVLLAEIVSHLPSLTRLFVSGLTGDLSEFEWDLPALLDLRVSECDELDNLALPSMQLPKLIALQLPQCDDLEGEFDSLFDLATVAPGFKQPSPKALKSLTIRDQWHDESLAWLVSQFNMFRNLEKLHIVQRLPSAFGKQILTLVKLRHLELAFYHHHDVPTEIARLLSLLPQLEIACFERSAELDPDDDENHTLPTSELPERAKRVASQLRELTLRGDLDGMAVCQLPKLEKLVLEKGDNCSSCKLLDSLRTGSSLRSLWLDLDATEEPAQALRSVLTLRGCPLSLRDFGLKALESLDLSEMQGGCAQVVASLSQHAMPALLSLRLPSRSVRSQFELSCASLLDHYLQHLPVSSSLCRLLDAAPRLAFLQLNQPKCVTPFWLFTSVFALLRKRRPSRFPALRIKTNFLAVDEKLVAAPPATNDSSELISSTIERLQLEYPLIGKLNLLATPARMLTPNEVEEAENKFVALWSPTAATSSSNTGSSNASAASAPAVQTASLAADQQTTTAGRSDAMNLSG